MKGEKPHTCLKCGGVPVHGNRVEGLGAKPIGHSFEGYGLSPVYNTSKMGWALAPEEYSIEEYDLLEVL
jgi:hypothetical protein